jgi:hypothetical protein
MKRDNMKPDPTRFASADAMLQAQAPTTRIVQVQLKAPVDIAAVLMEGDSNLQFASPGEFDLSSLRDIAGKNGLIKAEHSFRVEHPAKRLIAAAPSAILDPNKQAFIDLHFPETVDVQKIVTQLRGLPEVERAIEMPKAIPPRHISY